MNWRRRSSAPMGTCSASSMDPPAGSPAVSTAARAADLIVVDSKALDDLIKQGKVAPGRTDVARTGIGIAVRKGAPKPDVSSADSAQARAACGEIHRPHRAGRRRRHRGARHGRVREARHRRRR